MKNILFFTLLLSILYSCSSNKEPIENELSIKWLTESNDALNRRLNSAVLEKGNRKKDSTIAARANQIVELNRNLLNSLDYNNIQNELQRIIDSNQNEPQSFVKNIDQFLDFDELGNLNVNEVKRRVLIYELQALTDLSHRIGEEDLSFDKLDIYFVPGTYTKNTSDKLEGRLILTAMSERIGESADFYFDGKKLNEEKGYGVVNINRKELSDSDSIEIQIKFPEWQLSKSIKIN